MSQSTILKEASDYIERLSKSTEKANNYSQKLRENLDHLPKILKHASTGLGGFLLGFSGIGREIKGAGSVIMEVMEAGYKDTKKMSMELARTSNLLKQISADKASLYKRRNLTEDLDEKKQIQAVIDKKTHYQKVLQATAQLQRQHGEEAIRHNSILAQVDNHHAAMKGLAFAAELFGLRKNFQITKDIQQTLIETESSYANRLELQRNILESSVATGSSLETSQRTAAALAKYGFDLKENFLENVKLSTKLEEGLGMSAEHAVELNVVFGGSLKQSMHDVSTLISKIVDDTALSADEAARYAVNIGRSFAMLKGGAFSKEAQLGLTDFALRLEGASKQVTGMSGDFDGLLTRMNTTIEGIQQGAILGVRSDAQVNPEQITKGLQQLSAQLQGLSRPELIAQATQYARLLGVSANTIRNMPAILEKLNEKRTSTMDIEERWRNQTELSGQSFSKILNSFSALLHYGLSPFTFGLNKVLGVVNSMIQKILDTKYALMGVTGALAVMGLFGLGFAVKEVWSLTRALVTMAGAARLAARNIKGKTAQDLLDDFSGTIKGKDRFTTPIDTFLGKSGKAATTGAKDAAKAVGSFWKDIETKSVSWIKNLGESFKKIGSKGTVQALATDAELAAKAGGGFWKMLLAGTAKWIKAGISFLTGGIMMVVRVIAAVVTTLAGIIGAPLLIVIGALVAAGTALWQTKKYVERNAEKVAKSQAEYAKFMSSIIQDGVRHHAAVERSSKELSKYIDRQYNNTIKAAPNMTQTEKLRLIRHQSEAVAHGRDHQFALAQVSRVKDPQAEIDRLKTFDESQKKLTEQGEELIKQGAKDEADRVKKEAREETERRKKEHFLWFTRPTQLVAAW